MMRAAFVTALVALAMPAAALAHATLTTASPGSGARFESAPSRVVLTLSQSVQPAGEGIVVTTSGGRRVSRGVRLSADRRMVTARLAPLARGAYTVRWQVLSLSDGHVVSGVYTFGVRVAPPPPTEAYGAGGASVGERLARWLLFVGLALSGGAIVFRLLILPADLPGRLERRFYALVGVGILLVLNGGLLAFVLRAESALQLPVSQFLYADLTPFAEETRFGAAFVVMTLGFALVAALVAAAWLTDRVMALWPAGALALALCAGLSLSGHSSSEPNSSAASVAADAVHVSAAALWIGGLVALAAVVWPLAPELRRAAFLGFSRLAGFLVGIVVIAGVYLAILRLPAFSDLWNEPYGRALLVKLTLVVAALTWGAGHHFVVRPRLEAAREPVSPGIGRSLLGESTVAMAILLAAAFLVTSEPPSPPPPRSTIDTATPE